MWSLSQIDMSAELHFGGIVRLVNLHHSLPVGLCHSRTPGLSNVKTIQHSHGLLDTSWRRSLLSCNHVHWKLKIRKTENREDECQQKRCFRAWCFQAGCWSCPCHVKETAQSCTSGGRGGLGSHKYCPNINNEVTLRKPVTSAVKGSCA